MVQRSAHSTCGYHGWSPWRTCFISVSIFWDGMWLTQEPPCRFQTTCFQFSRVARFSQSVKVGTIWLIWKGRVNVKLISSSSGYGDGIFMLISRVFSLTRSCHFIIGVFLHASCIPHQNSQWLFWASVCVWVTSVCAYNLEIQILWWILVTLADLLLLPYFPALSPPAPLINFRSRSTVSASTCHILFPVQ